MIVFEPQIPWSLWVALVVAALAGWLWYALARDTGLTALRRTILLAMMAFALAAPLVMLLNPTWVEPIVPPSGKPLITVLVDATQSMLVDDCDDQTRWKQALQAAEQVRSSAGEKYDVSIVRFGQVTRTLKLDEGQTEPDGSNTNLAAVLRQAIAVGRPQGHAIALLSDGAHNVGSALSVTATADAARAVDVPIYTSVFGGSIGASNLAISARNPQLMTFPDRSVAVNLQLSGRGFGGRLVTVGLYDDGQSIAAKRVRLQPDGPTEVQFELRPDTAGLYRYVATVDALDGEVTAADNTASLQLQVIDEPIGVLLLEGKPYWDTKFLAANLAADPSIELTSLIRIRDDRLMRRTDLASMGADPIDTPDQPNSVWQIVDSNTSDWNDPQKLKQYRVIVLGRSIEVFLDDESIERLRHWISFDGGALVCARGEPTSQIERRLSQLLPVRWNGVGEVHARGQLTSLGRSAALVGEDSAGIDPITALPSLAIASKPKTTLGLPQVLVQSVLDDSGQTVPIVSHQPFGSGQSVVVEGAGMWRWAFLPPDQADAEKVYAGLWQGLMQWLISQQDLLPGQQLALRSDRLNYVTGDDVTGTVLVSDQERTEVPDCLVEGGDLELPRRAAPVAQADQPGVFRLNFGPLPPGHYVATLQSPAENGQTADGLVTEFDVRDPWFERLQVDSRPGLMRQISERSGGKVLPPDQIGTVASDHQQHLRHSRPERNRKIPLWDRSWVLLSVLAGWTVCWIARRQSGLI
ncbi:VWA domain-containing protein [Stieleria sp. TO1_6]|uniref:vWA domain-containing protein n=1 Tax=Stieleria tagensis TaxID=2956795 RepID=UPI00209AB566|nr:vWA domain-containing protein [Stieleria tagensis]MCO8123255.1 VWA domain-containing protein [Stieleria tagensis]